MLDEFTTDTRGIRFTMSAIIATAVLFAGLTTAYGLVPNEGERTAAEQLNEQQLRDRTTDFLDIANRTGSLKDATLYWDDSEATWVDVTPSGSNYYTTIPSGHPIETPLQTTFEDRAVSYNIALTYQTSTGGTATRRLVYTGTPGAHAVVGSTRILLEDDDNLVGPDSSQTVTTSPSYFAPDAYPGSNTYNIIEIRVIAWRT